MKRLLLYVVLLLSSFEAKAQTRGQLLDQISKASQDTNLVKLQIKLGNYYLLKPGGDKNNLDSALVIFNRAHQLSLQLHSNNLRIRSLKSMGNVHLVAKDYQKAFEINLEVAKIYESLGDPVQEATWWLTLTNFITIPEEAEKCCRQAMAAMLRVGKSDPALCRLSLDAGKFFLLKPGSEKSDMDLAFKYINQAHQLTTGLDNELRAQVLCFMGNYHIEAGDLEKGRNYFKEVLTNYQRKNNKLEEANTWAWLGNLLNNNGKNDHKLERIDSYNKARQLYLQTGHPDIAATASKMIGDNFMNLDDISKARANYRAAIDYYTSKNDKASQAAIWGKFGDGLASRKNFQEEALTCYQRQRQLLYQEGKVLESLETGSTIAELHMSQGKLDLAEKELLKLLAQFKANNYNKLFKVYDLIAQVNKRRGNQLKELSYRLQAVKDMEKYGVDGPEQLQAYVFAIINYHDLHMYDKSYELAVKLRKLHKGNDVGMNYMDVLLATQALVLGNRLKEAGDFLKSTTKKYPEDILLNTKNPRHVFSGAEITTMAQMQAINEAYGMYYSGLGQDTKAEKHYLAALKDFEMKRTNGEIDDTYLMSLLSKFYLKIKDYHRADLYLKRINSIRMAPVDERKTQLWLFKVDSAEGNYLSAINHLKQHQKSTDSLFSFSRDKKIVDMEVAFETRHKQDVINALQVQSKLQEYKYQEAKKTRNWIISFSAVLLLLLGVVYNRFRLKRRSNFLLESKQSEINTKNEMLQGLLADKDLLINEKDWLLKEVHHRVKNNLQIVMSLLSSQSAYLESSAAIEAIKESQNRVHTIALIHQKLYKSSNVASINLPAYIADLLDYLADSFDTRKRHIKFEQIIDSINLDLAQTVPLGLILNESITNAIKYAFGEQGGQILIALQMVKAETLLLTIADDGKGFDENIDISNSNSLGMEMMKALSHQLGGEFKIENRSGVRISIEFPIEEVLPAVPVVTG